MHMQSLLILAAAVASGVNSVEVHCTENNIKYRGLVLSNGIEKFLGIPYAQDTSGENRFKPPRPYVPAPGSIIDATKPGTACPQQTYSTPSPLGVGKILEQSENCLNLNIARPVRENATEKLPVMLWIHGGSFWTGSNTEPTTAPDGLIKQSVENGIPVMHVAINYRLGFFGFAQSDTLKAEGSENAGLRDQRLAIEWVRDHIASFGGDPERITILGQSSGGLAIGMQVLAYGGQKPLPFQRGVAESQSLEPGITGNFTIDAMTLVAQNVSCNAGGIHAPDTIACLRKLDGETLLNASIVTYASDIEHNVGDIWLPAVDGDFLPAAPSQLISEGRFGKADFTTGWTEDDLNFYTDTSITTAQETHDFIQGYLPALGEAPLAKLLSMYPVSEYSPGTNLSVEFYRAARIFRDILMVCPSLHLGAAMAAIHKIPVHHYSWNQTVVGPLVDELNQVRGMGVGHTSEFAYIFDSKEAYRGAGFNITWTQSDENLMKRGSRSWSTFAALGRPQEPGHDTLQSWQNAYPGDGETYVMTIGGPHEGLSALSEHGSIAEVVVQKLDERCGFLNSPEIIQALGY